MIRINNNNNTGALLLSRFFLEIIFFLTVALVSGNTNTHDYVPYKNDYYGLINSNFEIGYVFVSNLFKNLGFSFDFFKVATIGISMLLMRSTAKKFVPKSYLWIFYVFYLIFPMTEDSYNIRNTLAMSILIYSIPYLADNKLTSLLKFVFLIFMASLFHTVALIYLLLLFIKIYDNRRKISKKILKISFGFILLNIGVMILNRGYLEMVIAIIERFLITNGLISIQKSKYFNIKGNYGFLIYSAYQLISIYLINIINKSNERYIKESNCTNIQKEIRLNNLVKYVLYINVFLLILVPIYRNSNFFRIYRNIIPINHMALLSMFRYKTLHKTKRTRITFLYLIATIILAYIVIEPIKEVAFYTLFTDNWIINLLR